MNLTKEQEQRRDALLYRLLIEALEDRLAHFYKALKQARGKELEALERELDTVSEKIRTLAGDNAKEKARVYEETEYIITIKL